MSVLVHGQVYCSKRSSSDLLLDDILIDTVYCSSVILAVCVLAVSVQRLFYLAGRRRGTAMVSER
jgi:hypothetical protein